MNPAKLTKILYSSLALSCIDPHLLSAMDASMKAPYKRTSTEAGFEDTNQPAKRLCLRTPTELSELPISELIENAYKYDNCRSFLIEKIYNGFLDPKSLGINLKELLRLDSLKIAIETLTPSELHIICVCNPDNFLSSDVGKTLIINLQNKALHDPCAQNTLAGLYKNGRPGILEENLDKAIELYKKAANQGFAFAQYNLANSYFENKGIDKNYDKAFEWVTKAANQGCASAQNMLGFMYYNGHGVEKDSNTALKWFTNAANLGHTKALNNLGGFYYNGWGVEKDYNKALEYCTKAANQGDTAAQFQLGDMYFKGLGIAKDYNKALEYYTKAADKGHAVSQYSLGNMYRHGQGTAQDHNKALEYYTKAANQGDTAAQFQLGVIYRNGRGVTQDYPKALEYYTKAADKGHASAEHNLAAMYYEGCGIEKNYDKALEWFTKAAGQEFSCSQNYLGFLYQNGHGTAQDYVKALECYTKAANKGNEEAQNNIKLILSKKEDLSLATLANPDYINAALKLEMTAEIKNFQEALEEALGEIVALEGKNNPTGSQNTQGKNPGMAISFLYPYFQCCQAYILKITQILNHLKSEKAMTEGFLITLLELNPQLKDLGILKQQLEGSTAYVHLLSNPINSLSYFSFNESKDAMNIPFSKSYQEILDDHNPKYLKIKEAINLLTSIYNRNLEETISKAMAVQDLSSAYPENQENAQKDISILNGIIEKNKMILHCLTILNLSRKKLIEIIEDSTPQRNAAFSKSQIMTYL